MIKLTFLLLFLSINAFAAVDPILVDGSTVVQPVSGTFFQVTQPVSGTVTSNQGTSPWVVSGTVTVDTSLLATAANQTNRNQKTQLSNGTIDGSIKAASTAALAADTSLVVGLSPNSPLPTGSNVLGALSANQSVNQTQVNGVAVSTGSGVSGTGTQRVILASDQTAVPVTGTFFQATQPVSGTVAVSNFPATQPVSQVGSPWGISGTVTANAGTNLNTSALALDATLTNRTQFTKLTDGTRDGTLKAASTASVAADTSLVVAVSPNSPLPTGSNVIGALVANQSVNVSQINGVVVSTGSGTTGTGVQRVVLPADQSAIPTTQSGSWTVSTTSASIATYSAAAIGFIPAAAATDIFTITGSATKTIKISLVRCSISTTAGSGIVMNATLLTRSTANTLGTSTTAANVPLDSTNAAATATVRSYTANPTLGTLVGAVRAKRSFAGTAGSNQDEAIWDFGNRNGQGLTLRGITQVASVNIQGVTITNPVADCNVEYTEE